ncbi:MAG TPA: glycosyltransferase family A protein [Rhizomicrobium sp.]|jgi:succinoglycan biosynthesis protein ExoW
MIAIIIPYYQKSPGLLRRALLSVAAQEGAPDWRAYVVDDGSPAPVADELHTLPPGLAEKIIVLRQKNAGPGAARNLALDTLAADVTTVAFLDSDDIWEKSHLANIRVALEAGAEFYFADHRREEDEDARFVQSGYRPKGRAVSDANTTIHWCDATDLFGAVVQRSPVGTSTVALRRDSIGPARFRPDFRTAGEDSIFWLELLSRMDRVACGTGCEALYGRGISIFNHRSWGDVRSLRTMLDQMRAQIYLRDNFKLDTAMIENCDAQCRNLDLAFCSALLACGRRLQWGAAQPATAYVRTRPLALLKMPRATIRAVRQQFKRRPA